VTRITNALNDLSTSKRSYTVDEIFPDYPAPKRADSKGGWSETLGSLLSESQAVALLHLRSSRALSALVKKGEVLGLPTREARVEFPAFQFTKHGSVKAEIPEIISIFRHAVETPFTIASWLKTPKPYLENRTPIDWLERGGDPALVIAGAEQAAARLTT
jgi:hypothetical protein